MRAIVILACLIGGWPAEAEPLKHSLSEDVTGLAYLKSAVTGHKWQVQDFTTSRAAGALLVGMERDSRGAGMCYAVTDYDRLDASYFAVRVRCAKIK